MKYCLETTGSLQFMIQPPQHNYYYISRFYKNQNHWNLDEDMFTEDKGIRWKKKTIQTLDAMVDDFAANFKTSNFGNQLRLEFEALSQSKDITVNQCICIGLGSFIGEYTDVEAVLKEDWGEFLLEVEVPRASKKRLAFESRALNQLGGFEILLAELRRHHKVENIYMQDPAFDPLDKAFLTERGYQVVESFDSAHHSISPKTFLFAPFVEVDTLAHTLQAQSPCLYYGSDIRSSLIYLNSRLAAIQKQTDAMIDQFESDYLAPEDLDWRIAVFEKFADSREVWYTFGEKFSGFYGYLGLYYQSNTKNQIEAPDADNPSTEYETPGSSDTIMEDA
ncbi:MAG: hypothetical protein MMC33_004938 [Icmadophila ericetorum]|nr:hypothetical protein [Icmadophila ericetorum]